MFLAARSLVVALSIALSAAVRAQETPPAAAPALTLAEAVAVATSRHPDLAALAARAEAARARAPVERELMPPMLEAQAWQWPRDAWNPADAQWMFMVSQEFPGRGKREVRVARMHAEADAMAAEVPMRRREVAAEVGRAYIDLRVAREELSALTDAAEVIRHGVDAAEARYATGRGMQSDVLTGIVELSRLREEEVMAAERARMAGSRLNLLMGRPPEAAIGALDAVVLDQALPSFADLDAQVLGAHPEQALVDRRVGLAEAEAAVARTEARPDYVLQGGFMAMPGMTDAFTARAGITWPSAPWARRRTAALVAAAEAQARAAAAERDAVAQRLRLMTQDTLVRADAAQQRARVLEATVLPRVRHALETARVAYQADRGALMAMVDAQRTLVETGLRIRRALGDRDRALAELRAITGEFDPPQD